MKRTTAYSIHGKASRYGTCEDTPTCEVHDIGMWCCPTCDRHQCLLCDGDTCPSDQANIRRHTR